MLSKSTYLQAHGRQVEFLQLNVNKLETRKNRVISGEAGWLDDVEVAGHTKGIIRTDFHDTRR
ncbi:hypothetical protein HK12_06685 [Acetobacter orientalis]|uniref:Uncharacterized protein n=1 Tax=Acetobacter orientalis TaxID=146474 RepID=A0A252A187_9PROT|nr:hypothetical protein HK12_06685 [Acetobacter orientalis]